jgi:hypothetical protein
VPLVVQDFIGSTVKLHHYRQFAKIDISAAEGGEVGYNPSRT